MVYHTKYTTSVCNPASYPGHVGGGEKWPGYEAICNHGVSRQVHYFCMQPWCITPSTLLLYVTQPRTQAMWEEGKVAWVRGYM